MTEKVTFASGLPLMSQRITPASISTKAAQGWRRALEKLRIHQTDLHQRNETAKKANRTIYFGHAREGHTAARPKNCWTTKLRDDSDAERLGVLPLTLAGPRQSGSVQHAMEIDREVVRRFDEFWDSLVPRHNSLQTRKGPHQKSVHKKKLEKLFNSLQDAVRLLAT
jgi:hypothetical protein